MKKFIVGFAVALVFITVPAVAKASVLSDIIDWIRPPTPSQIVVTLNAGSPLQGIYQISKTQQTDNVLLAKYDVKSQNVSGILRSLRVQIKTEGASIPTLFGDIKISVNGHTYSADSVTNNAAIFEQLYEVLPADQYVTVGVYGRINQDSGSLSGTIISTALLAAGENGGAYNNPSVITNASSTIDVNETSITSSQITVTSASVVASGLNATLGVPVVAGNTTVAQPATFTFTLTAGNDTAYISKNPNLALATSSTGFNNFANAGIVVLDANPGTVSGDTNSYFVIPAGSSRTFMGSAMIKARYEPSGLKTFKITAIKYSLNSNAPAFNTINYGLQTLMVTPVIGDDARPFTITATPGTISGDSASTYIIPAGSSRSFKIDNGNDAIFVTKVSGIVYTANPATLSGDSSTSFVVPAGSTRTITIAAGNDAVFVAKRDLTPQVPPTNSNGVTVSGASGTLGAAVVSNNTTVAQSYTFNLTLTSFNNDIYISKDPNTVLQTTQIGFSSSPTSAKVEVLSVNPGSLSGDSSAYYVIPAGTSRKLTFDGVMRFQNALMGPKTVRVDGLRYGTLTNSLTANTITSGIAGTRVDTVGGDVSGTVKNTISIALQPSPADGTTLAKGQEADIAAYKLLAGASDMTLNSVSFDFDARLWLFSDAIAILDGSKILAYKDKLSASDFIEISSNPPVYQIKLPVSNYVIPKNAERTIALHLRMATVSDRTSATIQVKQIETRATDSAGISDVETMFYVRSFNYDYRTPPPTASTTVAVTSPNGGETLLQQKSNTVSWKGGTDQIRIGVVDSRFDKEGNKTILGWINLSAKPNGSMVWNGYTVVGLDGISLSTLSSLSAGPYRIIAVAQDSNGNLCTGVGCNYDVSNGTFTISSPTNPPINATVPTVSVQLLANTTDRAGIWGNFGPGAGNVNKNPADWNWFLTINSNGITTDKVIKRITIKQGGIGEAWSTGYSRYLADGTDLYGYNEHPYPLVIMSEKGNAQLNSAYDQVPSIKVSAGVNNVGTYVLYGQKESAQFSGGKIIVEFTDGTMTSAPIAAGTVTPPTATPSLVASNQLVVAGATVVNNNQVIGQNIRMSVSLTNTGDTDVYLRNKSDGADITAVLTPSTASVVSMRSASPATMSGDTSTALVIPAGTTRKLQFDIMLRNTGEVRPVTYQITGLNYGISAQNPMGFVLTKGIEVLKGTVALGSATIKELSVPASSVSPSPSSTATSEQVLSVSCYATPTNPRTGDSVSWRAIVAGGQAPYTYSWSGTDGISGSNYFLTTSYSNAGSKITAVTVRGGTQTKTASCSANVISNNTYVSPSPSYSPTYSPEPTYYNTPTPSPTYPSEPQYEESPSESPISRIPSGHNFVASVFYAVGDLLDSMF